MPSLPKCRTCLQGGDELVSALSLCGDQLEIVGKFT